MRSHQEGIVMPDVLDAVEHWKRVRNRAAAIVDCM